MKINFILSCELEVDPSDWRDAECIEQLISQLEEDALNNIDEPVVVLDTGDAAQLWALVRPEGAKRLIDESSA